MEEQVRQVELPRLGAGDGVVHRVRDEADRAVVLEELGAEEAQDVGGAGERPQPMQDHEVVADEAGGEAGGIEQQGDAGDHRAGQRGAAAAEARGTGRRRDGHGRRFLQATW